MSNFCRKEPSAETTLAMLTNRAVHDALVDPNLLLSIVETQKPEDRINIRFVSTPRTWLVEVETVRHGTVAAGLEEYLLSLLAVVAPEASFKSLAEEPSTQPEVSTPLAPGYSAVEGASGAVFWLPPEQCSEPDFKRALGAARTRGIQQLLFSLRSVVLTPDNLTSLKRARFRLENEAGAQAALPMLIQWIESGRGCGIEIEALSNEPLSSDDLNLMRAALFGTAAHAPVGTPELDLRLAVPSGRLPGFRFWPTPNDFSILSHTGVQEIPEDAGSVVLGRDAADDPVRLGAEDRMRHLFVIGGSGTGKSTLVANVLLEDISKGHGVMLVDPHGDLADLVRASVPADREKDVIWMDAGDERLQWRFDLFAAQGADPATEHARIAYQMVSFFRQQNASCPESVGPAFEQWFTNTFKLLASASDPNDRELTRFEDVLLDDDFRHELMLECPDRRVVQFFLNAQLVTGEWQMANMIPYITNKMAPISSNPLVAALVSGPRPVLDLRWAMDQRKIVIVRLSKGVVGEYAARLLGALVLMALSEAAMGRARIPASSRIPCRVFIDEFADLATQSAASILSECRKYGLSMVAANQSLSQLSGSAFNPADVGSAMLANCGTLAVFRVNLEDARRIAAMVDGVSAHELTQLGVGDFVVRRLVNGVPAPAERLRGLPPDHWPVRRPGLGQLEAADDQLPLF